VGPLVGTEGASETWSAAATDPGTSDSLTIAWHWGDGTPDGSSTSVAHTYADDGTYTLTATATDGDGGSDTETLQVVISNVAPAFASAGTTTADEAVPYSWTPSVTEPGPDVLAFSLVGPAAMTLDSATGELQWTPSYADATSGPHAVSLTVDDGDGGTAMVAWNIDVVATDADGDGLPDGWEIANNLDPTSAADATEDDDGDGLTNLDEFAGGTDPASYDGPSAPTLVDPLDGGEAGARPELVLLGATDPQGDALTLTVEVYSDHALTTLAAGASMAQVEGENRWIVDVDLPENADVWWRARAADAAADGPWSDVWQLFINGTEEAPPTPTALYPVDDEVVSNSFPHVEWAEVEDADRDPVHYLVEVAEVAGAVVASVVDWPAGEEAFLTWDIDAELTEDGRYEWTVAAADDTGLQSDWSEPEPFLYSRANAAPEGIAWVTPANGAEIDERSPLLEATEGVDVEGDPIGYLFEFSGTSTFDDATYTGQELPATGTGQVSWDLAAEGLELPWGDVFARVRGGDGAGASSPPDSVSFFVLGGPEPTPEPTPTDTCADCGSSIGSESGMELSLAILACMVIFIVVRRHRTPATQEPTQ
jgi:PKD repeat protein